VAVVINPKIVGLATGFKLKIMTPSSRGDNKHLIPIYQAEDHYYTTAFINPINYLDGIGTFTATPNIVTLPADHKFVLKFTQPVLNTDTILIKYPTSNHRLTSSCTPADGGYCFVITDKNWIIYRPLNTLAANIPQTITF
jgi:hypothetical protein